MTGGGTGGHVIPALAVAGELRAMGHEVTFVGTRAGIEARLAPAAGFPIVFVGVGALNRVGWARRLRTLATLPFAVLRAMRIRAEAVFSMGGFAAGPMVLAAILRGTPVVAMEPNAVPGFTHRRAARWLARVLVNFEETARWFPEGRAERTGVPVRPEFFAAGNKTRGDEFVVLVTGGSQGARTLSRAAREAAALAGPGVRIVLQAGRGNAREGEFEFIEDMPAAFAGADLIVCRAGAATVAEVAAAGKPAVLVPFPFAADDHQARNAEAMAKAGAAVVVPDAEMTGERLAALIAHFAERPEELKRMGEAARSLARPGAARRAAEILVETAEKG